VLAPQITQGADKTAPAVAVIIVIACPALTMVAKILQQQIKHPHRLSGFCLWHWTLLLRLVWPQRRP
jgi:hypothetical protein